jgi:hypothetical protein
MASAAPFIMKIKYYAPTGGNREKTLTILIILPIDQE